MEKEKPYNNSAKKMAKPYNHGTMTEAQFLAWIRSILRSKWLRWIPRGEALKLARRPYKGTNKAQKWEYECAMCGGMFGLKEVEVDHIKEAGAIPSIEAVGEFCKNLYCEIDNLRILCCPCHSVYTYSQKHCVSLEEAKIQKRVISYMKETPKNSLLAYLKIRGYKESDMSNETKRRNIVEQLIRRGKI